MLHMFPGVGYRELEANGGLHVMWHDLKEKELE